MLALSGLAVHAVLAIRADREAGGQEAGEQEAGEQGTSE